MADETPKATETLVKKTVTVVVGERPVTVATFRFAKTVRALGLITEIAEVAGLGDAAKQLTEGDLTLVGIIQQLVAVLPKLLVQGVPVVYKFLGLIITPNKELRELEESEVDLDAELFRRGRDLAYEGEPEEVLSLVAQAVQVMGVETIVKNVAPLVGMLRR